MYCLYVIEEEGRRGLGLFFFFREVYVLQEQMGYELQEDVVRMQMCICVCM